MHLTYRHLIHLPPLYSTALNFSFRRDSDTAHVRYCVRAADFPLGIFVW